jgi:hypothetical protein
MREGLAMSETTISTSETAHRQFGELAEWSGVSLAEALERAVKEYDDRQFWAAVNAGYAARRADAEAWPEVEAERQVWDTTLMDGLDPSERWAEDGSVVQPPTPEQAP